MEPRGGLGLVVLLFPESHREAPVFIPRLKVSGPQGPAAPEPCVWAPGWWAGEAGRLLSLFLCQHVPGPGCLQGEAGMERHPVWEEATGQLVYTHVHTRNAGQWGGTRTLGGLAGGPE